MKLSFKTLNKQSFTIEAEATETIADIKKKVAESQSMDSPAMKLIHSGKIMADEKAIEFYNVKESDQIICMAQKPKQTPVASAAPSTPAPQAAQTPSAPAPAPSSTTTQNAPATPSPAPAQTARSGGETQGGMTMGPEREAAIANLVAMGFDRPLAERAMRAAFFNPDRAVEYLLNGIPENVEQQQADRLAQRPQATPSAQPPAAANTGATGTAPAAQSGGDDEPVNLFEAAAAARGGAGGGGGGGAAAARGGAGGAGAGAGGLGEALGGAGGQGDLSFLRDNATFQQLRQMVQSNPTMLENVLQQVAQSNPALAQMIQQNPDQFIQLLSEGGAEGDMPQLPPGAATVTVTEEERQAIERLCGLGFSRDNVIQAYFACDKNEELAANFLFENGEEHDDE